MPWTGPEFREKHDQSLTTKQAEKAAEIATAMVRAKVPDGEAIATAIKHVEKMPEIKHNH